MVPKEEVDSEDREDVEVPRDDGAGATKQPRILSRVSKLYDMDGDGELNAAERALRELDSSDRGFITNERAYKLVAEHIDMQNKMFQMKRVSESDTQVGDTLIS